MRKVEKRSADMADEDRRRRGAAEQCPRFAKI
jgi:hypothetical protein